ncbi:MAG TPA: transcription elongation factor GreA [Mycobacteriales bacterium]|nr:transcription elongation factor GreA [Mycobacteriales bacterium]
MSETTPPTVTWLTQDAYDRLQNELAELSGPVRETVVARIAAAREEGDLKENGGYHAAKDEQGKLEARIRVLTELLRDAQVGDAPVEADRARAGTLVEVQFEGDDDTETFLLGSREDHVENYQIYSPSSPLGGAVLGHQAGETVSYIAPRGATMKVSIVSVQPYVG